MIDSHFDSTDSANCGNAHIDNLAALGRMVTVWHHLSARYRVIADHYDAIREARKSGRLRWLIEKDSRFESIRKPYGPASDAEWELLKTAVLEASGIEARQ